MSITKDNVTRQDRLTDIIRSTNTLGTIAKLETIAIKLQQAGLIAYVQLNNLLSACESKRIKIMKGITE